MNHINAIILAAGKGTRLKSVDKNKVVKTIGGQPMINYTAELINKLKPTKTIVVVGFQSNSVKKVLGSSYTYAVQKNPSGTGHAVKKAIPHLEKTCQHVLVLNGDDSAFYKPEDIEKLITTHQRLHSDMTLLTVIKKDPAQLGRIIRDQHHKIKAIVEFKNATLAQKQIKEVNTATYCFKKEFLTKFINSIQRNPVSKEYYLTEMLEIAVRNHQSVSAVILKNPSRFQGINNLEELQQADNLKLNELK
jgi:UDP-N-acetylglucosamine diphosphorylase/glucosamine-1-phosphate N-acetyltransferase